MELMVTKSKMQNKRKINLNAKVFPIIKLSVFHNEI